MKIAVCFSGQARTAIQAGPNLIRFFGDLMPEIDFFIHTWDINEYKRYGQEDGFTKNVTPPWRPYGPLDPQQKYSLLAREVEGYKKMYNPKTFRVESHELYLRNKVKYKGRMSILALYYSWRESIWMCKEYAEQNNVKYDVVVKLRPDMIFPYYRTLRTEILNYMTDTTAFYEDNYEDLFWLGSLDTMLAAAEYGSVDMDISPSVTMRDYINGLGIEIKQTVENGYAPLRPEALNYNVLTHFPEIFYTDHLWFSTGEPMKWIGVG